MRERAVVREEKGAGRVDVQPTDRDDARIARDEVDDGAPALRIPRRRDHAGGLVEEDVGEALPCDFLSVHLDAIVCADDGVELAGRAVDRDAAVLDELVGLAARGDASASEERVETHVEKISHRMQHVFATASLVCTGLCVGSLAYLHLAPTGYSPVRDAVSRYGVGTYARWYQAQAAFCGAAGILLAIALRHPADVVVLLVMFGVARLAITRFPMDSKREVHWLLAVVGFGSVAVAASLLKPQFHGIPELGWVMFFTLLFLGRVFRLTAYFGLAERVFYVAMLTWLVLICGASLSRAGTWFRDMSLLVHAAQPCVEPNSSGRRADRCGPDRSSVDASGTWFRTPSLN